MLMILAGVCSLVTIGKIFSTTCRFNNTVTDTGSKVESEINCATFMLLFMLLLTIITQITLSCALYIIFNNKVNS